VRENLLMEIDNLSIKIISSFTELIYRLLKRLRIRFDVAGVHIFLEDEKYKESIDERIARIDLARTNLIESLHAIDELKDAAERNKREVEAAVHQLAQLEQDKMLLQKELDSIKTIAQTDVETFRKVAGVLTPSQIRRERVIGFISGVVASTVASGIAWAIVKLIQYLISKP
jgi:hypothetical protein